MSHRRDGLFYLLAKRLRTRKFAGTLQCLHLIEALIKNLGLPFANAMGTNSKLVGKLKSVAKESGKHRGHDALTVNEKILDMIQGWGEEFLTHSVSDMCCFLSVCGP